MKKEETKTEDRLGLGQTRVSNHRQDDGTHEMQEAGIRACAAKDGIPLEKVFNTTMSGDSDECARQDEILAYIDGKIKRGEKRFTDYYCFNIERFTRGGHAMYDRMKRELASRGVRLRDVAGIIQPERNTMENLGAEYDWSKYFPSEAQELLEADRAKDNKRDMLTRMIGQEIINAREGYAVHPAPDGFINLRERYFINGKPKRRSSRKRDDARAPFYEKMFELRATGGKTDEQIIKVINGMGYRSKVRVRWSKGAIKVKTGTSGGIPLTAKQLQVIVQRPIYAGVNYEKWVPTPVRTQYAGLVSIKQWNEANRGRWFIEELRDGTLKMHQNYAPEDRTHDNPLYPFKEVILCPHCKKPFHGSASRSKSGKHVPAYHCDRKINGVKHKRVSANKWKFEEKIEQFVSNMQFQPDLLAGWALVMRDTFNKRQAGAIAAATDAGKRVIGLQEQKAAAVKAYIAANAAGDEELKRDIQAERARIDQQLQTAQGYRDTLEVTERDLDEFMSRVMWIMEHPQEFLLRAKNKPQRIAYFSLMFDELPTYQDVIDGTPKLAWVFKLDDEPMTNESDNVRRAGFEPA